MKVLITGISGLLGSEIARSMAPDHDVIGITQTSTLSGYTTHHVDLCNLEETYALVTKLNPDLIIHTAALSNVDECERNPDAAFRINALGTRNLALACQRFDTALLYISTDYAFSGIHHPPSGYTEFDPINPVNFYAKSKIQGEEFVKFLLNKFYIVRVSWLFGANRNNFVTQIAASLLQGKEVKVASDMISAPTYVKDLAQALDSLTRKNSYGTYHLTNTGFASRYEIGIFIADIIGAPKNLLKKVTLKELLLPAQRPSFSGLRNYLWELEGSKSLRPWQDAVKSFLLDQGYLK